MELKRINSATKYPSIPTYHALGERGRLTEERNVAFEPAAGGADVVVTEKLDGTNARVVVTHERDWLIGSREELLTARGDRVHNPALGIVDAVRAHAEAFASSYPVDDAAIVVLYGEVYGGKTTAARHYGAGVGFRVFDVQVVRADVAARWTAMSPEELARWRDGGGQVWLDEDELVRAAACANADVTPRLGASAPPVSVDATAAWLAAALPDGTRAALDSGGGGAEGVVVRTPDRGRIAKIRFEDYARTLRAR